MSALVNAPDADALPRGPSVRILGAARVTSRLVYMGAPPVEVGGRLLVLEPLPHELADVGHGWVAVWWAGRRRLADRASLTMEPGARDIAAADVRRATAAGQRARAVLDAITHASGPVSRPGKR